MISSFREYHFYLVIFMNSSFREYHFLYYCFDDLLQFVTHITYVIATSITAQF